MPLSRRHFLMGCSSAIAALAGARLTQVSFASAATQATDETLVVVFLRGAWDVFNVFPVLDGPDRGYYESARPDLRVNLTGENSAVRLPNSAQFGLHAALAPLLGLYQDQKLAITLACGLNHATRSHFDAMQFIETGTGGTPGVTSGWLTRHLQTTPHQPSGVGIPALSANSAVANALLGYPQAVSATSPGSLEFTGNWQWRDQQRTLLRQLYDGDHWLFAAGTNTLDVLRAAPIDDYTPANNAQYPNHSFGTSLQTIAQMIKHGVGLQTATVDFGGWDTHESQGAGSRTGSSWNYFHGLLDTLARGLLAFYTDLNGTGASNYTNRVTVLVMSEFGRRLRENASGGTDHGHGSAMLLLGGGVNGGQIYGRWPGLANEQLFDGADLAITTDYRHILSEVLVKRAGQPLNNLPTIFPGYSCYDPLGLVQPKTAADAPPQADLPFKVFLPLVTRPIQVGQCR